MKKGKERNKIHWTSSTFDSPWTDKICYNIYD